ncbi:twitching motility protein PilT [Herbaspirillum sp. HC18]|nr:twitching motility protein PilT [Herbaspirillum sp. HC18]
MVTATFRFYEELNDFLAPGRRKHEFDCSCARAATTKHMIEALGVPHTEVELVLVNGDSVGFDRLLQEGDRVTVYPKCESLDITSLLQVRDHPLRVTRFVADVHLGGLARLLRMAGFDTRYETQFSDEEIAAISAHEDRIALTRDRALLMRREITHGCYVRALKPSHQLREIVDRLDLTGSMRPFTLCLHCNAPLHDIDKSRLKNLVPAGVLARYDRFSTCKVCLRVFWEGSHWQRMRALLNDVDGNKLGDANPKGYPDSS